MSAGGWIILLISVGTVITLFAWCLCKVLSTPDETERIHGYEGDRPGSNNTHSEP